MGEQDNVSDFISLGCEDEEKEEISLHLWKSSTTDIYNGRYSRGVC